MKNFKSYILGLATMLAMAVGFASCQDDVDAPRVDDPVSDLTPNTTLLELKQRFWNEATNYADSIYDPDDESHRFIIHGRVISSDEEGNVFKSLVIQDETAALAFSIDSYNLYLNYRVGQEIVMDVTGMTIGKYAGLQQMGRKSWYSNGSTWQVSFMSLRRFAEKAQLNGTPKVHEIDTLVLNTFEPIKVHNQETLNKYQSQLVRFRNVHFEEGGQRKFSVWHTKENSEQNTNLLDRSGNTLIVRTSGYCTFFNQLLPVGEIDLVGILGYYNGSWQIIMIDGEGVLPAGEVPGSKEKPYTVEKAIEDINGGVTANAWVKGYIVGALQPEIDAVTSNADIQWTAPTILSNNIIIAPSADTQDYTKCMVVRLPSGSVFQATANLKDNASVIGKEILVKGDLAKDYGMAAITNNGGSSEDFEIAGVKPVVKPGAGVTVMATAMTVPGTTTIDGYQITVDQASGATAPALHSGTSAVRLYNGNTINFKGGTMTTIKFTLAKDAGFRYTNVKCSSGTITPEQKEGDTEFTWVGSTEDLTLTVSENADLGSDGPEKRGQIRFTQIDINGGGSGTPENPDTPDNPDNPGTATDGASILASALTVPGSSTVDGYVINIDKAGGFTEPAFHSGTSAVRLYNGNTMSVSGGKLTSIKFVLAKDAGFRYTTVTCSTGAISPAQKEGDTEFTWVGDATNVTFTVSANADLGSDGPEKRGQIRFTQLDINGGGKGDNPGTGDNPGSGDNPGTPSGDVVNIAASALTIPGSSTVDGYTVAIDQATSATAPTFHTGTSAARVYAGGTITVSGGKMASIKFTLASDAAFRYTTVACSTGAISPAQAEGDTEFTWVGNADSVTFTVGEQATLGSDGESKKGQIRFTTITVTPAK